ncbi:MAG: 23S rRNA (uracil(1939)-C(5))-methyltransferase RlmD [Elusimicrobiaceae bacterium]
MTCPHFGTCGGCSCADIPYEEQLRRKTKTLSGLFACAVETAPSPDIYYYRNKMEFSFSRQIDRAKTTEDGPKFFENRLGMKEKGRWDRAFDLNECHISTADIGALIKAVRQWAETTETPYSDVRRHEGVLRHLLVRTAKNTGGRMVVLFTRGENFDKESFAEAVTAVWPDAAVLYAVNNSLSDTAQAEKLTHLAGPEFITEKLRIGSDPVKPDFTLDFKITPRAFLQTNTRAAQKLYSHVRGLVGERPVSALYDLYGGSGGLGFACHDKAEKIISVEFVPDAVQDGIANAQNNKIGNIEFVCAKTEDWLEQQVNAQTVFDGNSVFLLDPPRAGLHPKALENLVKIMPARIIYVSCNPKALDHDLKTLLGLYNLSAISAFDMFPHTEHVETVAVLDRK